MSLIKKIKKEHLYLLLLIIISCIYIFGTHNSYYYGDDLSFHLNRLEGIADAFRDGQIIPRIYPNINYGFGYGSAMFYCDFFLYPFAALNLFGVKTIDIFKIIIVFYSIVSVFNAYYCSKKVFKKTTTCLVCTTLFILSSYRLYDVYNRAALGELIALAFVPCVLYSIYRTLYLKEDNFIQLALSFSALVLSHLISSVLLAFVFLLFIIIFIIFNFKNWNVILKAALTTIKAVILALLLCSWFLLPMLEQIRSQDFYCFANSTAFFGYYPRVELISDLINPINGINIFDITIFVLSFIYIASKKNKIITILFISSIVLFLIMTGYITVTRHISFIQFMFRLNIIIYPFLVIIVSYIFDNSSTKFIKAIYLVVFILLLVNVCSKYYSLFNSTTNIIPYEELQHKITYDPEQFYFNRRQISGGEYLPVCYDIDYLNGEKNIVLEEIDGEYFGILDNFTKKYTHIDFDYGGEAKFVSIPLTYYKGYVCYVDGNKHYCVNDELYKKVGVYLEEGNHHYTVYYGGTLLQYISLFISFSSIICVIIYLIYKRKIYINKHI